MRYISKQEYEVRMQEIKKDNISKGRKLKLEEEKRKFKPKSKLPSTSKLVLFGMILLCLEIVIFCEYAMISTKDTSALYALIGVVASLVPVIFAYYSKSGKENSVGGIVYDMAMAELNQNNSCNKSTGVDSSGEAQG